MSGMTERTLADAKSRNIKETINCSGLDFMMNETPYSLCVKIRKKFVQDRSQQISPFKAFKSTPQPQEVPPKSTDEDFKQEINRLKNKIEEKEDTIKKISKTTDTNINTLQESTENKSLQIQALKCEILNSQKQFQTIKDIFEESKKQFQMTKDKLAENEKQLQTTHDKLTNCQKQFQTTKEKLADAQKQLQTTNEKLSDYPKQLQSTKDKLVNSQKELQSTNDKLNESHKQLKTNRDLLANYPKQLQSSKDKLDDSQKELQMTKDKLAESQKQIQNLTFETKRNGENILKFKTELETTKEKLSHSQNQLKTMKTLTDKAESKCLEKDQKLKLLEKDFEDKLVNSQNNVKAAKVIPADSLTTFTDSPQTDTQDRPADPPKKLQNNGDKPPDFQTLLATKDQNGHNIIKRSTQPQSWYFRVKCTLCRETESLNFENHPTFIFNSDCPFSKPPDFRKHLATMDLKGHSVILLETCEKTNGRYHGYGHFLVGCSKCHMRSSIHFAVDVLDYALPYKCQNA